MTEICGQSISNSWLGGFLLFLGLLIVGLVLWGVAELATRRYERRVNAIGYRRAASWRPPEVRELEESDD